MTPARSGPAPETKRGRLLGGALSLTCHLLLLYALFWAWPDTPVVVEPQAVSVELVGPPAPSPAPKAAAPAPAAPVRAPPVKPPPRRAVVKPPPPDVDYLPAEVARKSDTGATLTEAQLAGATVAGSGAGSGGGGAGGGGGGGGPCDMAARIQSALRRDPMVRAAAVGASGKAILLWNGDWVRNTGEDGKGLAIIREAILWEVGFAPPACRAQPVRGIVVLSLSGAGGPTRLALGGGSWRWSDLLALHSSSDQ
jgi:hypothetical protein